ncbi:lysine transporter LysE [Helicobacter apodemus]|uniref:Lysine transporter LysE n=2 Tax=Helicobacter apodemus TaxID=135569 RepID=A0A2U8FF27_9HELI|nr:lysine transporter LysE [Helicobacter apodemus]
MLMIELLLTYTLAVFLLIITPGPVIALIIRNASLYGFKTGFFTSIGVNLASLILLITAIAIILGILKVSPLILSLLSLLGCVFIFYLGASSLYDTFKSYKNQLSSKIPTPLNEKNCKKTLSSSFLEGFGLAIGNPKDIIFLVAFFPQFIHITNSITLSLSILVTIWVVLDVGILVGYVLLTQKAIFFKYQNIIGIMSNIILIFVGVFGGYYLLHSLSL